MTPSPLKGAVVLDASRIYAGPFAAQILGDLGAQVVKLENPEGGDDTRTWKNREDGASSAYFSALNRGKKSIALDLKSAEGRRILDELLRRADILVENFLPGTRDLLGLCHDRLRREFPQLVVVSITGFGSHGSWSERPGYDFMVQALSGFMAVNRDSQGVPQKAAIPIADIVTGLSAATAAVAAYHQAKQIGQGSLVETNLLHNMLMAQGNLLQHYFRSGEEPRPRANEHFQIAPYRLYETADGSIVVAVTNDQQWQRLCSSLGVPELRSDPRFSTNRDRVLNRDQLDPLLGSVLKNKGTGDWMRVFLDGDIPAAPVLNFGQTLRLEPIEESPLKPGGWPILMDGNPVCAASDECPDLGEHTEEVLRELLQRNVGSSSTFQPGEGV